MFSDGYTKVFVGYTNFFQIEYWITMEGWKSTKWNEENVDLKRILKEEIMEVKALEAEIRDLETNF